MKARYCRYILDFIKPGTTSRGVLNQKESFFLLLEQDGRTGIGECGILRGLSADDVPEYEAKLQWLCDRIQEDHEVLYEALRKFPSIQFGLEQARISLESKNPFLLFPSAFTADRAPIPINGLIWMGDFEVMHEELSQKLNGGYRCIKIKIGAIEFERELELLREIRRHYSADTIEIRVDANGAFSPKEAMDKLEALRQFDLHSIEQPIKPGQPEAMAFLCQNSPVAIALDEELIGIFQPGNKAALLDRILPQYLVLKPSFVGGFQGSREWMALAEERQIKWWITSALESNIGLNAIAQWTYTVDAETVQGLGTGTLFRNNFASPLLIENGNLYYDSQQSWQDKIIDSICT